MSTFVVYAQFAKQVSSPLTLTDDEKSAKGIVAIYQCDTIDQAVESFHAESTKQGAKSVGGSAKNSPTHAEYFGDTKRSVWAEVGDTKVYFRINAEKSTPETLKEQVARLTAEVAQLTADNAALRAAAQKSPRVSRK